MNILVLGNGFDLAHELPTAYPDFLGFCRMIMTVYSVERNCNVDEEWRCLNIKLYQEKNTKRLYDKFCELCLSSRLDTDDKGERIIRTYTVFDEMYKLLQDNYWFEYFVYYPLYQKENWIDFESEISNIIKTVDKAMCDKKEGRHQLSDDVEVYFSNGFLEKYFETYALKKGELTYRIVRDSLYSDLVRLIRALEIYLTEYVEKLECNVISPDIAEAVQTIRMYGNGTGGVVLSKIICFNYTNTYKKVYFKDKKDIDENIDFIHGKADICNTIESNNMVLGIDEYLPDDRKNQDVEFIAFKKYYQRIYKETGCKYKGWVERIIKDSNKTAWKYNNEDHSEDFIHNLYIFGHSLDATDGDILRELILHDNVRTTIFYHDKDTMGKQIANLVKVIGQDELIRRTGGSTKTIKFRLQQRMVNTDLL